MTTSKQRLGGKVRGLRRREGLTQMELAAKLEISPSYLNLIEHNQRPLPAHLLVKLAQAFRVGKYAHRRFSPTRALKGQALRRPAVRKRVQGVSEERGQVNGRSYRPHPVRGFEH